MPNYEPRSDPARPSPLRRPRNREELENRYGFAATSLLIAGLVAALYSPRFEGPSLLAATALVCLAASVWWQPSTPSVAGGLVASFLWLLWAGCWHATHPKVIGAGPHL